MSIKICDDVMQICNELSKEVVIASIIAEVNVHESSQELKDLVDIKCKEVKRKYELGNLESMESIDHIKKVYRKLGTDPTRYKISSEALFKRVIKDKGLFTVNNVVEVNNIISLISGYPVCAYDLEKIQGEIKLSIGKIGEKYEGIGRGEIRVENIPVFYDEIGAFGSTTSDSTKTMVTEKTSKIIFSIVSFNVNSNINKFLNESIALLEKYCDARVLDIKLSNNLGNKKS